MAATKGIPATRRVVVITGGSSGIGKQLAADLLRRGDVVGILAHDPVVLFAAEKELSAISPDILALLCDVTEEDDVVSAFQQFLERFGHIDVLVNNAGWATYRTFEETSLDELLKIVDINFTGVVRTLKAVLPSMIARRSGHIVNIASLAGTMLITPNGVYGAAKHAVMGLSEALRYELARFHIAVTVICPGRVETPFFDHETFQQRAPRKETSLTVSLEEASAAIVRAIDEQPALVFVPKYWRYIAWLYHAFPWIVKPFYSRLMLGRVESIYGKTTTVRARGLTKSK
jgi:short-subunit dehydrogenase